MTGTWVHPLLGPVKYKARELPPDSDGQVTQTLNVMREKVAEDSADPDFRYRAQVLIGDGSDWEKMHAAYRHTKGRIKFQRDEETGGGVAGLEAGDVIETIIRPVDMAAYVDRGDAVGDCDDFSMYLAALLRSVGIPCAFVTVAADGRAPDQFSHVYVIAWPMDEATGKRVRVALDASHGEYPGWEVPNQFGKYTEWPVMDRLAWWVGNLAVNGIAVLGLWFGVRWIGRKWGAAI